jgi:hypothetical protein
MAIIARMDDRHTTIDHGEPGREIEDAALAFTRGEPVVACSKLRSAVELLLVVLPHASRHESERAVLDEFLTRVRLKLADADDAGDVLRRAREQLDQEFPIKH